MINLFFDTEFTHLWESHGEPAQLLSIGVVSEDGRRFYAENLDYDEVLLSDFVLEAVMPHLEGGDKAMHHLEIAQALKAWIEGFRGADGKPEECKMWTDAPNFDWPFVVELFSGFEGHDRDLWPANLRRHPASPNTLSGVQALRYQQAVEDMLSQPHMRRHHALDDALASRAAWLRLF